MTETRVLVQVASVSLTFIAVWLLPWWGMRAIMPGLERSAPRVRNYRGAEVPVGLGVVWAMWCAGLLLIGAFERVAMWGFAAGGDALSNLRMVFIDSLWPVRSQAMVMMVFAAFAFGLIDDAFGDAGAKGFRGHLKALAGGRLTTGMLKVLGIGATAAWLAVGLAVTDTEGSWADIGEWGVRWVLLVLIIALTANFLNLLDLRPGRALKGYLALAVPAAIAVGATAWASTMVRMSDGVLLAVPQPWLEPLGGAVGLLIIVIGPAVAVWKFDLGERGILGDGGANAAGALAGYLFAASLPTWGLFLVAAVVVFLNLASERVSFTKVIGESEMLSWFDGLGRVRHPHDPDEGAGGAPVCGDAEKRYDPGAAPGTDDTGVNIREDGGSSLT